MSRAVVVSLFLAGSFLPFASAGDGNGDLGEKFQALSEQVKDPQKIKELKGIAADTGADEDARLAAIRDLRGAAAGNSDPQIRREVRSLLHGIAANTNSMGETPALRRRAVQSLGLVPSLDARRSDCTVRLLKAIADGDGDWADDANISRHIHEEDIGVREMAVKALHWATVNKEDIRAWMAGLAQTGSPEILKRAALWALGSSLDMDFKGGVWRGVEIRKVKDVLIAALQSETDSDTRVAALRGLYPVNPIPQAVKNAATDADAKVRDAANLFLQDKKAPVSPEIMRRYNWREDPVTHLMREVLEEQE